MLHKVSSLAIHEVPARSIVRCYLFVRENSQNFASVNETTHSLPGPPYVLRDIKTARWGTDYA